MTTVNDVKALNKGAWWIVFCGDALVYFTAEQLRWNGTLYMDQKFCLSLVKKDYNRL